jgi:hypothetical protein
MGSRLVGKAVSCRRSPWAKALLGDNGQNIMLALIPFSILASILIGYFGRHRRMGFWGMTFCSIVLTPLVGFIILVVTDNVTPES